MRKSENSWQSVQHEVLNRIRTRQWQPGTLIPNEIDLAKEFGCARTTVNRALRELAATGVLQRRRKTGTRVALHPVHRPRLQIPIIRHDIQERGATYGYQLVQRSTVAAPAQLAHRLELPLGHALECIVALHLADGQPFVLEDRWVNLATVPEIATADLTTISANEWLAENVRLSEAHLAFYALAADAEMAQHLASSPGTALFVMHRTTRRSGELLTDVRLIYAADYRMCTQM